MTLTLVRRAAVALAVTLSTLPSLLAAQATGSVRGHVTDAAKSERASRRSTRR